MADLRKTPRHAISLPATIENLSDRSSPDAELRGTLISIGASGCAIRTTARLAEDATYLVTIHTNLDSEPRTFMVPASLVWERDDFRIDTFYLHGLRFNSWLSEEYLALILREEALCQAIDGALPSQSSNKEVA